MPFAHRSQPDLLESNALRLKSCELIHHSVYGLTFLHLSTRVYLAYKKGKTACTPFVYKNCFLSQLNCGIECITIIDQA